MKDYWLIQIAHVKDDDTKDPKAVASLKQIVLGKETRQSRHIKEPRERLLEVASEMIDKIEEVRKDGRSKT